MPMPKATMDEYNFSSTREYDVGLSREVFAVEAKTVAETVN